MSSVTAQSDIDRVRQATDLVQLIGEHVALTPKGREHVGLCPFHEDSRPSLAVVTHKGNAFYKCHACGASGDAFTFVVEYLRQDFRTALQMLANRAGITLTGRVTESTQQNSTRDIKTTLEKAAKFFQNNLKDQHTGRTARAHLEARHVSLDMVEQFGLGLAPDAWDGLLQAATRDGVSEQQLESAGLVRARKSGSSNGYYDTFRNRLMFPIRDELGQPIAFGGRVLNKDDEPKYVNSPETSLFKKSRTLYGLDVARRNIIDLGQAIVTEGYTDVIACHQAGFTNAVGTLGTALTTDHATTLARLAPRVVLIFDGDQAGQRAADRAVEVFFSAPVDVFVSELPTGMDPADLLDTPTGTTEFQSLIDQAPDALSFKLGRLAHALVDEQSISGRQQLIERAIDELASLGLGRMVGVRRHLVVERLAEIIGIPIRSIDQMLKQGISKARVSTPSTASTSSSLLNDAPSNSIDNPLPRARRVAERELIAHLLFETELGQSIITLNDREGCALELFPPSTFGDGVARSIASALQRLLATGVPSMQQILADLAEHDDEAARGLAAELYFEGQRQAGSFEGSNQERLAACIEALAMRIQRDQIDQRVEQLHSTATAGANSPAMAREVLEELRRRGPDAAAISRSVRT